MTAMPSRSTLDPAFGFAPDRFVAKEVGFLVLAVLLHIFVAQSFPTTAQTPSDKPVVTEVELPPAPDPPPTAPPQEASAVAPSPATKPAVAAPPPAARAGALLTAKTAAPAGNEELVEFVTDPNGTSYGSGVVARGGTAERGEVGAALTHAQMPARTASAGDGLTPNANLSRRATLDEPNACAGSYPTDANVDSGSVTLTVVVRGDGVVTTASVLSETPANQGFGHAARTCIVRKRFTPALDRAGNAVATSTTLKVGFVRR